MKWFSLLLFATILPITAFAQNPSTQPAKDLVPGKTFRSRVAGIEFAPPASGTQSNALLNGEVARFINTQQSWDLSVKSLPLHKGLPLMGVNGEGVLSLIKGQLTDTNQTAQILSSDVISKRQICNGAPFGLIEARYDSATDRIFSQQAIFRESNRYYLLVEMTSHGKPKTDIADTLDPQETQARDIFNGVLGTVHVLDRSEMRREQDNRLTNTHLFYMGLDEKKILSVLQPLHFVRLVRDGKDVGFIQMNERQTVHSGSTGVEVVVHSRLQADLVQPPVAAKTEIAGMASKKEGSSYYYASSSFFVTFDRKHEGWTTTLQLDDQVLKQTTESANSDQVLRRKLNTTQAAVDVRTHPTTRGTEPPVLEISDYTLDVAYATGPHQEAPTDIKLPPYYLPQAISQLLPRLLPPDPTQYMFAFYVSGQRSVLARYIDVGTAREVELDDQKKIAIPITDRIGADGSPTIHYVTRQGQWLGSITEEAHLQMLPTDETTLKSIWPGFVASPEPLPEVEVQNPRGMGR